MDAALNDDELLRRMAAGDAEAFAALYRRWGDVVHRFALQMSGSPAIAEDVTQEVFMALMREPRRYDSSKGSLSAYLYGIARHQVLRQLTKRQTEVQLTDEVGGENLIVSHPAADPLGELTRNETIDAVRRAVLCLPEHYREVVVLCELHEMSYAEASAVLGCAVGTVRSRLHRARTLLTEKLRQNNA
ncbi:MAG TPA: RNA polymerase sigma factor, partial [Pyrinomonadaceae bacterium]|nr:RNA polymerase sigma factor [Pyrinomonadaceae bacterium]